MEKNFLALTLYFITIISLFPVMSSANTLESKQVTADGDKIISIIDEASTINEAKKTIEKMNIENVEITKTEQNGIFVETLTATKKLDANAPRALSKDDETQMVTYSVSQIYPINGYDGGYRVQTYLATLYESETFGNLTGVKITGCNYRITKKDPSWTVSKISGRVGQSGAGFYSNGTPTVVDGLYKNFSLSNPVSGKTYSTTGVPNKGVFVSVGNAGSNMTVSIKRTVNNYTETYTTYANVK